MKKYFLLGVYLLSFSCLLLAKPAYELSGLWEAHNDKGDPTGFIRITQQNSIYTGVIEKGLPSDKEDKFCNACTDDRKDQKLIGMTILKGVKADGDGYKGAEILDPFSGKTYRVKLSFKEAGEKLKVRGYIGVSLFGRTQIWRRVENGQ